MPDAKASLEPVEWGNKGCSVVGYDFLDSSPVAYDFIEEERAEGASRFRKERRSGHTVREKRT